MRVMPWTDETLRLLASRGPERLRRLSRVAECLSVLSFADKPVVFLTVDGRHTVH